MKSAFTLLLLTFTLISTAPKQYFTQVGTSGDLDNIEFVGVTLTEFLP